MKKIIIINGPNLNLLGNREEDVYGNISLEEIKKKLNLPSSFVLYEVPNPSGTEKFSSPV